MTEPTDPHAAPPPSYQPPPSQQPPSYQPPPSHQPPSYQPPEYQPPPAYQPPPYGPPPAFGGQAGPEPSAQYPAAGPDWQHPYAQQWPAPQPPQPSHTRRNVLIAVAVVVVLAAAGIGSYFAFRGGSGSSNRLALPTSFAGFSQEHDATASRVERTLRGIGANAGGQEKRVFDASTIAVYQKDSDVSNRLIAFALPTSKVPHGQGGTPTEITAGLLSYMGSDVPEGAAGPHGGSSRCGATSVGAASETACAWSDPSTTGMLVSVGGSPLSPSQLGRVELALRDRVD